MTNDFPPGEVRLGSERVLAHLIVVAGLKGAGKSTFIRSIRQRTFPPPIAKLLPQEAAAWPALPAGEAKTWLPDLLQNAPSLPGAILHYDLQHLYKFGPAHPSTKALALARRMTVINVVPTRDRLTAQFNLRESTALLLRMPRGKQEAKEAEQIRVRRSEMLGLYATPGWAEQILASWNDFLREAAAETNPAVIEIEPVGPVGSPAPAWRLKPTGQGQVGG